MLESWLEAFAKIAFALEKRKKSHDKDCFSAVKIQAT